MADALVWEVVKRNSAFLVKRNGSTRRTGTITLTKEPFNVSKKNTFKDSGLANSRAVDLKIVSDAKDKYGPKIQLVTKSKKGAFTPKTSKAVTPLNKNFRASASAIKSLAKHHYRADLQKAALARYTLLKQVVGVKKGQVKKMKVKKGRGNKA